MGEQEEEDGCVADARGEATDLGDPATGPAAEADIKAGAAQA